MVTDHRRDSSRVSHALASFQSRFTLRTEISSVSVVCSRLIPAKKRNSTTRALRGSISSRAFKASSRAIRSSLPCGEAFIASSRWTCSNRPPRLFARCARASSTRIRRHDLRRKGKEVGAIFPSHSLNIRKTKISLVYQGTGLEDSAGRLTPHIAIGDVLQFGVNQRVGLI